MINEKHILPENPHETPVDLSHTKLLYYACNELLSQRVSQKRTRRLDSQPYMHTKIPDEEPRQLDYLFVELPRDSRTKKLEHTFILEACTKGWFRRGRYAKHVLEETDSGYPTITLNIERSRHLTNSVGGRTGSFVLRSEISYTCMGLDSPVVRQIPESVDSFDVEAGKRYAERYDQQLLQEIYPYWENKQHNRKALEEHNYDDLRFVEDTVLTEETATIHEFGMLMRALFRL